MSKNKGVKKTLAVFLAALMVMSCWVFTPISFKAEAATMTSDGYYEWKVTLYVEEDYDWKHDAMNVYVDYYTDNGYGSNFQNDGTSYFYVYKNQYENDKAAYDFYGTSKGFPTRVRLSAMRNNNSIWNANYCCILYVKRNGVWQTLKNTGKVTKIGAGDYLKDATVDNCSPSNGLWPKPTTIVWDDENKDKGTQNITIPGSATIKSHCLDQYGVRLACDPTYTLSTSPVNSGITGTQTDGTSTSSYTVSAPDAAKMAGEGKNSCSVSATVSYKLGGGEETASRLFVVNDPKYTVTLDPNGGELTTDSATVVKSWGDSLGFTPNATREGHSLIGFYPTAQGPFFNDDIPTGDKVEANYIIKANSSWYAAWRVNKYKLTFTYRDSSYNEQTETSSVYYGSDIAAPTVPTTINVGIDYTYTFKGWSSAVPSTMPANDATYIAQYNETVYYATPTELINQINAAENKKTEKNYTDGAYTDETTAAFESALSVAKALRDNSPLKSQQNTVDTAAENLKTAIANLKIKTFTVLFVDEDGNILKDGYFYVSFGSKVAAPEKPEKDGDHDKHYEFIGWDSTDSDDLSACNYVTDDLKFIAKFKAENHSFTTETVPSTCTADGVIKYTCSCGYSYTETNADDTAHHKFVETTVKAATCSDNGIKANVCSVCGVYENGSIKSVAKTGHTYGAWETYTPATCIGQGVEVRKCSCGAEEYRKTDRIAHTFGETTVVAPTCTTDGYSTHTCSACGLTEVFDLTNKTDHKFETNRLDPTCVNTGYVEERCQACGFRLVELIPATGEHSYGEWVKTQDATCISKGVEEHTCSSCKRTEYRFTDKLTEHAYGDWTVYQEATCTSDRIEQRICSICGKVETNTVKGTMGHTWDADFTVDFEPSCISEGSKSIHCSACGTRKDITAIPALGHDLTTKTVEASCLVSGKTIESCSRCDYEKTTETSPALDHDFQAVETVPATCGNAGYTRYECSRNCGVEGYTTYDAPATNDHEWAFTYSEPSHGVITVTAKCKNCNANFTDEVSSSHKFENVTVSDYIPASCVEGGVLVIDCGVEGCTESHEIYLEKNPDAHKSVTTVVTNPTCTEDGKAITTCDYCDKTLAEETIPAKGHSYSEKVDEVPATCMENGYVELQCACGATTKIVLEKNADAHKFVQSGEHHDADCTTPAYDEFVCEHGCGATYKNFTGTAKEHEWNISVAQDGTTVTVTRTCKLCGKVETDTIEVFAGHHYGEPEEVSKATCSAEGKITLTCTDKDCGDVIEIIVAKNPNAHKITTVVENATCTDGGKAYSYCELCEEHIGEDIAIAALGHDYNGEETIVTPATCTESGSKTVACTRCDSTKEVTIPKLGHSYIEKSRVEPTCTENGYIVYVCENDESHTYNALLDKLGHTYDSEVVTEPTCTEQGYTTHHCKTCGNDIVDSYTDALGHDFSDEGEIVHQGNCAEQTVILHHCQRPNCAATKYEYIGTVGNHDYKFVETVAPTCTEEGYDVYKCDICDFETKKNRVPALGHDWDYWKITKYPTTDANGDAVNGMQERTCKRCGKKDYQEIIDGKFYLVTFYNHDGTRLLPPAYYAYGTAARTPDFTPTRVADTGYTYTFREWNFTMDEINCVTKRMAIIAQYDAHERSYAVTYQNEDGTVLQQISKVKFTKITTAYTAATPTKASDEYYDYTFASWSITCNSDESTAVATATFTAKLKDSGNTPDSGKPGILTGFFAKLREFFKMIFDKIFGGIGG